MTESSQGFSEQPIVVVLHGMNASPQWGFFPTLADRIALAGFMPLVLSLSHERPTDEVDYVHSILANHPQSLVHFLGHSRGGAIAQIVAAERNKTSERVVVWAGIGVWLRRPVRQTTPFTQDVAENSQRLDIHRAATALRGRIRYLHAEADVIVPRQEVEDLANHSGNHDALTVFSGSTHTFGITHPMTSTTGTFEQAIELTLAYFTS
ncbi:MAG: dienelactone hydrolase family protein, partial [Bradyrhizobiaceae bacterium]|nr:dienelactone hydrolase family protein [Bradyrhizobiaceae bacterium]